MTTINNEPFALVFDYFRAPLRHALSDVNRTLQPELDQLLGMLNGAQGDDSRLARVASQLGVSEHDLEQAIYFYLKQSLFSAGNDYYQLLGLSSVAEAEEIKNRYRVLIRLFHPDKMQDQDEWDEPIATRLNEAYNTLKKPELRSQYDRKLATERQQPQTENKAPPRRPRMKQAPDYSSTPVEALFGTRLWQRHPKLMVIMGLLLLGLLVLYFLLGSSGSPTLQQGQSQVKPADPDKQVRMVTSDQAALDSLKPEPEQQSLATRTEHKVEQPQQIDEQRVIARLERQFRSNDSEQGNDGGTQDDSIGAAPPPRIEPETERSKDQPENGPPAVVAVVSTPREKAEEQSEADIDVGAVSSTRNEPEKQPEILTVVEAVPPSRNEPPPVISEDRPGDRSPTSVAVAPQQPQAEELPEGDIDVGGVLPPRTETVKESETPAVAGSAHSPRKPVTTEIREVTPEQSLLLIEAYVQSYEAGDHNQMAALFTPDAVIDRGQGAAVIEQHYHALFRKSSKRQVTVDQLETDQTPHIVARLEARVLPAGDAHFMVEPGNSWQQYLIDMELDLVRVEDRILIARMTDRVKLK